MPKTVFGLQTNGFQVVERDDGTSSCEGAYHGLPVSVAIPLSRERCIILLSPESSTEPTFENLLCVTARGDLVWQAKLPSSHDAYVNVRLEDGCVIASSWSGYSVRIDADTGELVKQVFTK